MAAAISPNTGRAYGVARVCDGFGVARSSFYAGGGSRNPPPRRRHDYAEVPNRRSRTPRCSAPSAPISTARPGLVKGIAKYGRGCASVDGIRVARKRVLRLMRENGLLSPTPPPGTTRRSPRRPHHHHGAKPDVGHRRNANLDRAGWQGLAVCRRRPLERGSYGVARCQDR